MSKRITLGMFLLRLAIQCFPIGFRSSLPDGDKWIDLSIIHNG